MLENDSRKRKHTFHCFQEETHAFLLQHARSLDDDDDGDENPSDSVQSLKSRHKFVLPATAKKKSFDCLIDLVDFFFCFCDCV